MRRTALLLSGVALLLAGGLRASEPLDRLAQEHLENRRWALGLDARHGFSPIRTHQDEQGSVHVRVQQRFRGVKVFGGEAILHLVGGRVAGVTDALVRGLDLDTIPGLAGSEALAISHAALRPEGPYASPPTAELVIAPDEARCRLAFHVHAELENGAAETLHADFLVDAHSGAVLDRWSTLMTTAATGSGASQYSGAVNLDTNATGGGYELRDLTRGTGGNTTRDLAHGTSGTGTLYTDADDAWGDGQNYVEGSSTTAPNGQTAAVDAHYGLQATWDYYAQVHGRNGIDAAGSATYSRVHYSNGYDNAFWSDACFCMTYGDGTSFTTLTSLDVAGHEMSHGVCARTAALTYRGESGGLNEANSDINGTMVEFHARGGSGPAIGNAGGNWTIGEQLAATPLRYMYRPSLDGRSPDFWSKALKTLDVHYSSGVANHFFYLLSQGTAAGISPTANGVTRIVGLGNDAAARIWYRALTVYMTSSTTYSGARAATLSAASDLYGAGSPESATVALAWKAVNVVK